MISPYYIQRYKYLILFTCVLALIIPAGFIANNAVTKHYELEQEKLKLARYQFDVQADQANKALKLQAANETIKALEIVMNSRLVETTVDLLGAPKKAGNAAANLAVELIKRFNVNVDLSAQLDSSTSESPNTFMDASNEWNISSEYYVTVSKIANNTSSEYYVAALKTASKKPSVYHMAVSSGSGRKF